MEEAFEAGYDPALELATHVVKARNWVEEKGQQRQDLELEMGDPELETGDPEPWTHHLRRKEQDFIDLIVKGEESGPYYVLLGAKVALGPHLLIR